MPGGVFVIVNAMGNEEERIYNARGESLPILGSNGVDDEFVIPEGAIILHEEDCDDA